MNLFETLLHPDREELELGERTLVAKAANILQVGEFQILQLAYRDWYGKDMPSDLVEGLFTSYMLKNDVPHWARHYARKIHVRESRGLIDDSEAAYHIYDHDYHTHVAGGIRRFWTAVVVLTVAIGGALALADLAAVSPATRFPPYLETSDLKTQPVEPNFGRADTGVVEPAKTR
ncbi:MAG: hypothetical protein ACTSV1_01985 [Alphaproteobacteria bacterium]